MEFRSIAAIAVATLLPALAPANAATIFADDFNSYSNGSATSSQSGTGLAVRAFGTLAGWTRSGVNAVHAVDRGAGDWGVMFYGGGGPSNTNSIEMNSAISANSLGVSYTVSFEGAAANYANAGQGNLDGDVVMFDVLNGLDAIVASYVYDPANWTNAPSNPFTAGSFSYVGNGSGDIRLRIYAAAAAGRFGGAIDNLAIDAEDPTPVSEPAMLGLFGLGALGLGLRRRRK